MIPSGVGNTGRSLIQRCFFVMAVWSGEWDVRRAVGRLGLARKDIPGMLLRFTMPFLVTGILRTLCNKTSLFIMKRCSSSTDITTMTVNDRIVRAVANVVLNVAAKAAILVTVTAKTGSGEGITSAVNSSM